MVPPLAGCPLPWIKGAHNKCCQNSVYMKIFNRLFGHPVVDIKLCNPAA